MEKICIYCGDWFECRDHVIPVSFTSMKRNYERGTTVPSCNLCNIMLSNRMLWTVERKVEYLILAYKKRFRKILRLPVWTEDEIKVLDFGLRSIVINGQYMKEIINLKLNNLRLVSTGVEASKIHLSKSEEAIIRRRLTYEGL